jgi:hypothetical protein
VKKTKQPTLGLETVLPAFINSEAWNEWLKMRVMIKKPATEYAQKLALQTLWDLKKQGFDPNKSLDQSTFNNWTALYEPRGQFAGNSAPNASSPASGSMDRSISELDL